MIVTNWTSPIIVQYDLRGFLNLMLPFLTFSLDVIPSQYAEIDTKYVIGILQVVKTFGLLQLEV